MINMQQLMQQAQAMQRKLQESQEKMKNTIFEGKAGGGSVKVQLNGTYKMVKIDIKEGMLDKDNKDMLEDLILVAYNNCKDKIDEEKKNNLGNIGGNSNLLNGMF
ncbi:MAG: YbaB/EbfC family nucleoid-associated protein [Rickettsiales bacterium]|nr:YbaB/EbfC family nucleoid-associated protein [Rickettsiales bacterium]